MLNQLRKISDVLLKLHSLKAVTWNSKKALPDVTIQILLKTEKFVVLILFNDFFLPSPPSNHSYVPLPLSNLWTLFLFYCFTDMNEYIDATCQSI